MKVTSYHTHQQMIAQSVMRILVGDPLGADHQNVVS